MKRVIIILLIISLMILIPFAFAKKNIQLAPSQQADVSVAVTNSNPVISDLTPPSSPVSLSPGLPTILTAIFIAEDINGENTLNDATAQVRFTNGAEERTSILSPNSCTPSNPILGDNKKTYTCSVTMQYYDNDGQWTIIPSIGDTGGGSGSRTYTNSFIVNLVRDISLSPTSITFPPVSPGASNTLSLTPDIEITNRGNYETSADGPVLITGADLNTNPVSANKIPAANFKAGLASGGNLICTGVNEGTILGTSSVAISSLGLARGATGNTVNVKYCLTSVPSGITSTSYSGVWTIGI